MRVIGEKYGAILWCFFRIYHSVDVMQILSYKRWLYNIWSFSIFTANLFLSNERR